MQSVNEFTTYAAVSIQNWIADAMERLHSDEEGQTAVEYAGILALLGVIFAAIFALGLDTKISTAIKNAVDGILKGK
jgi:Flp pilus assembly pilin Flp